jgi:tetratricopeptide (TPR) repeat protein
MQGRRFNEKGIIMADSPLELYEKAYGLHYEEKRIAEACELYGRIIKEFPESNECGYAVIQLEKLKANSVLEGLAQPAASVMSPLAVASLALNFIAVVMLIAACAMYVSLRRTDRQYVAALSQAVSWMESGQNEAALKTLSDLKFRASGDIVPYALSADIYARSGKFSEALAEIVKFRKMYPSLPVPQELGASIEQQRRRSMLAEAPEPAVEEPVAADAKEKSEAAEPAKKSQPVRASRPVKAKSPTKPVSHKDSTSFF